MGTSSVNVGREVASVNIPLKTEDYSIVYILHNYCMRSSRICWTIKGLCLYREIGMGKGSCWKKVGWNVEKIVFSVWLVFTCQRIMTMFFYISSEVLLLVPGQSHGHYIKWNSLHFTPYEPVLGSFISLASRASISYLTSGFWTKDTWTGLADCNNLRTSRILWSILNRSFVV
jgi:hypothetical protein